MKVFLLMAGFGTRLRPLTWSKPKPLVPVAGRPVLGHVLDTFVRLPRIDEVIFVVGFMGEQVQEFVQKTYPKLPAKYVEQKELLGQSHALWLARESLQGPAMILFVDTLIETDFSTLTSGEQAVACVKRVEDPRRFGVAELGANGLVRRLVEKPATLDNNLVVVGCYFVPEAAELRDAIQQQMERKLQFKGEFFLADAFNLMLEKGLRMRVQEVTTWEDCGKPDALLHSNQFLLEHGRDNSNSVSREGVVIVPPVFIDPGSEISHSIIGPNVSIAAGCRVDRAVMQNCIVDEEADISQIVIADSLIGRQAKLHGKSSSFLVGDSSELRQV